MDPDRTLKARRPRSLIVKLQGGRGATLNNTEVEAKNIYHIMKRSSALHKTHHVDAIYKALMAFSSTFGFCNAIR